MENKTKILAFAAVALMFAVCFIGFVAINDDAVDADGETGAGGATTTPDKGPLGDMCPEGMTYANNEYTFTSDVTITLTKDLIGDNGLKGVKFVGAHTLTITSANEGHYALDVTYNFGTKIKDDAGRIFQVSNFVLKNASLNVVQLDDKKTIDDNQPGGSVFGEAQVTVQGKSTMTITTNEYANRVFYNNNSSMSIIGGNAKVILNNASSLTASLSMTDGAILEINNPINTAGNFYPNISNTGNKCSITVDGASNGNHGLFFYGSNAKGGSVGVLKNCNITTNGIVGIYGSNNVIDATGTIIEADSIVAVKASNFSVKPAAPFEAAGISNVTLEVKKVSKPIDNSYDESTGTKILKLEGVTFNGSTVIDSGVSLIGTITNNGTIIVKDATGLKTAVAAGGKISLAGNIEITDHDNTGDKNGLKITKRVEIDGNKKKISFTNTDTIYGLVFSGGCGGSILSNVSLDFDEKAKYGLCVRDMTSTTTGGVTFESVIVDGYGKTGIDLNGINGTILFKNVEVKGNGHYVDAATNLTRGHGYALVIDDLKNDTNGTQGSVITENCTIASVNVHNFCGAIPVGSVDLRGCNGLLFVSVEDGSKNTLTSVYDKDVDHKKQNGHTTIINEDGLLIEGTVLFPTGFETNKYAIFNTKTDIENKDKGDNAGSFEILRAYRVCYGLAFFDTSVNIVKDYTINCDVMIPKDVTVTIAKDATLTISDGVKLCNGGTITNNGTISLSSLDVLKKSKINSGNVILNGNITIDKDYDIPSNVKFLIGDKANVVVASGVTLNVAGTVGTNGMVTLAKDAKLIIAEDSTFTGTINGPDNNKLVANGMKAGEKGITITGGSLIINGKIMNASGTEAGVTVTVTGDGIKISGSLDANVTMVIEKDTIVTVKSGEEFSFKGTITNNGTLRIEDSTKITTDGASKVVNNGVVVDERAKEAKAIPVTNDGTVVAKNNADEYKGEGIDVIVQDPDKPVATEGKIEVNTNKYAFITPITTTGKLNIIMNDGYKQYTVTIPEGTSIAAGTVISVSFIEYQSDSVTRYQINTPGIENFSMKLPCQIGFKKAKVYCDDSEMGVSKVRYNAGAGYVTFDASHNSVFTIVLSNTSPAGTTTVSGGDASNDYSLVIAFVVLVASLGFLAYVIKRR